MTKYLLRALRFAAVFLAGGMLVPNPASAQNVNDLLQMFGDSMRQATRQAAEVE
jgi:hypothetical protein